MARRRGRQAWCPGLGEMQTGPESGTQLEARAAVGPQDLMAFIFPEMSFLCLQQLARERLQKDACLGHPKAAPDPTLSLA